GKHDKASSRYTPSVLSSKQVLSSCWGWILTLLFDLLFGSHGRLSARRRYLRLGFRSGFVGAANDAQRDDTQGQHRTDKAFHVRELFFEVQSFNRIRQSPLPAEHSRDNEDQNRASQSAA